jgi:hypothetical protein
VAPTAKARPPPAPAADEQPPVAIRKVDNENYGAPTRSAGCTPELNRLSHQIAKRTVHRLMRAEGLSGMSRAKGPRTTIRRMRELDTLAPRRGLEAGEEAVHRPGPGCSRDGSVDPHPTPARTQPASLRTWTREASTSPSGTPSGRSRPALSAPWGPPASITTMPWQRIGCLEIAAAEYAGWLNHFRLHGRIGLVPPLSTRTTTTDTCPHRLPSAGWFRADQPLKIEVDDRCVVGRFVRPTQAVASTPRRSRSS